MRPRRAGWMVTICLWTCVWGLAAMAAPTDEEGRLLYEAGQYVQSRTLFQERLAAIPAASADAKDARLFIIRCSYELLDIPALDQAVADYAALYPDDEILGQFAFSQAKARDVAKDYAGAAEKYQAFLAKYPQSEHAGPAMFNLARLRERSGEYGKAASLLRDYLAKYPGSKEERLARYGLAENLRRADEPAQAAAEYRTFLERYPDSELVPPVRFTLIELSSRVQDSDAVIEQAQIYLTQQPAVSEADRALFMLALAYAHKKDLAAARQRYEELLAKYPGSKHADEVCARLAAAKFELWDLDGARTTYDQFFEKYPESPLKDKAQLRYAKLLREQGDYAYLSRFAEGILASRPGHGYQLELKLLRAVAELELNNAQQAAERLAALRTETEPQGGYPEAELYEGQARLAWAARLRAEAKSTTATTPAGTPAADDLEHQGRELLERYLAHPGMNIESRLDALGALKNYDSICQEAREFLTGHGAQKDCEWMIAQMWLGAALTFQSPADMTSAGAVFDEIIGADLSGVNRSQKWVTDHLTQALFWRAAIALRLGDQARARALAVHIRDEVPPSEPRTRALQGLSSVLQSPAAP